MVFCSIILMRFGISDSLLVLLFAFDEGQSNMLESSRSTRVFDEVYVNSCDVSFRLIVLANDPVV